MSKKLSRQWVLAAGMIAWAILAGTAQAQSARRVRTTASAQAAADAASADRAPAPLPEPLLLPDSTNPPQAARDWAPRRPAAQRPSNARPVAQRQVWRGSGPQRNMRAYAQAPLAEDEGDILPGRRSIMAPSEDDLPSGRETIRSGPTMNSAMDDPFGDAGPVRGETIGRPRSTSRPMQMSPPGAGAYPPSGQPLMQSNGPYMQGPMPGGGGNYVQGPMHGDGEFIEGDGPDGYSTFDDGGGFGDSGCQSCGGGGCDQCNDGCGHTAPGCGPCGSCGVCTKNCGYDQWGNYQGCCLRFYPGLWENISILGGVQGFKGPLDSGLNGNFGFHEGVNWGVPVFDPFGIGGQIGFQAVQSDLSGTAVNGGNRRNQYFITGGLFHRPTSGVGFQGGAVYDYLHDDFLSNMNLGQVRGELSYITSRGNEFGVMGAAHTKTQFNIFGLNNANMKFQATNMYTAFYRRHFQTGAQARIWGGATGDGRGLVGGDFTAPIADRWSIDGNFNYGIPKGGLGAGDPSQENWGMMFSLVWHPGYRFAGSRFNPYRPLFNVADNSTFFEQAK